MEASIADQAKIAVGEYVAGYVCDGMTLGVGTGSTAARAVEAIGRRLVETGWTVQGVPTSFAAERLALANGIRVVSLDEVEMLDLAFDGADEVSPDLHLIKGRGAAHAREKVVAASAKQFVVLVDAGKLVECLGERMPVPVEVMPMAVSPVAQALRTLGANPVLRLGRAKDGPVVTDQGLWVLDAKFSRIEDAHSLDRAIHQIPGILEHGLFVDLADEVLVGQTDGTVRRIVRQGSTSV